MAEAVECPIALSPDERFKIGVALLRRDVAAAATYLKPKNRCVIRPCLMMQFDTMAAILSVVLCTPPPAFLAEYDIEEMWNECNCVFVRSCQVLLIAVDIIRSGRIPSQKTLDWVMCVEPVIETPDGAARALVRALVANISEDVWSFEKAIVSLVPYLEDLRACLPVSEILEWLLWFVVVEMIILVQDDYPRSIATTAGRFMMAAFDLELDIGGESSIHTTILRSLHYTTAAIGSAYSCSAWQESRSVLILDSQKFIGKSQHQNDTTGLAGVVLGLPKVPRAHALAVYYGVVRLMRLMGKPLSLAYQFDECIGRPVLQMATALKLARKTAADLSPLDVEEATHQLDSLMAQAFRPNAMVRFYCELGLTYSHLFSVSQQEPPDSVLHLTVKAIELMISHPHLHVDFCVVTPAVFTLLLQKTIMEIATAQRYFFYLFRYGSFYSMLAIKLLLALQTHHLTSSLSLEDPCTLAMAEAALTHQYFIPGLMNKGTEKQTDWTDFPDILRLLRMYYRKSNRSGALVVVFATLSVLTQLLSESLDRKNDADYPGYVRLLATAVIDVGGEICQNVWGTIHDLMDDLSQAGRYEDGVLVGSSMARYMLASHLTEWLERKGVIVTNVKVQAASCMVTNGLARCQLLASLEECWTDYPVSLIADMLEMATSEISYEMMGPANRKGLEAIFLYSLEACLYQAEKVEFDQAFPLMAPLFGIMEEQMGRNRTFRVLESVKDRPKLKRLTAFLRINFGALKESFRLVEILRSELGWS